MKWNFFKRAYSWIDMAFLAVNFLLRYEEVHQLDTNDDYDKATFQDHAINLRFLECIGTILLYVKITYFISLVDAIAPLVDTIWRVLIDIFYFMVVLILHM